MSCSLRPAKVLCLWGFSRQEYWSGLPFPPPGDLPNSGIEPRSPTLQAHSLPTEPPGKPKNIGVNSLSLCQKIFLTQESNQDLLHCRRFFTNWAIREAPHIYWTLTTYGKGELGCALQTVLGRAWEQADVSARPSSRFLCFQNSPTSLILNLESVHCGSVKQITRGPYNSYYFLILFLFSCV